MLHAALQSAWSICPSFPNRFHISNIILNRELDKGTLIYQKRKTRQKPITPRIEQILPSIQDFINQGFTLKEISERFDLNVITITRHIKHGRLISKPSLYPEIRRLLPSIQELLDKNFSLVYISKHLNVCRHTLLKCIKLNYLQRN